MNGEQFESLVLSLLELKPFRLFTIELNGGKRFEIDHPRALSLRDGTAEFMTPGGMPIWFDHNQVSHIFPDTANTPTGTKSP